MEDTPEFIDGVLREVESQGRMKVRDYVAHFILTALEKNNIDMLWYVLNHELTEEFHANMTVFYGLNDENYQRALELVYIKLSKHTGNIFDQIFDRCTMNMKYFVKFVLKIENKSLEEIFDHYFHLFTTTYTFISANKKPEFYQGFLDAGLPISYMAKFVDTPNNHGLRDFVTEDI